MRSIVLTAAALAVVVVTACSKDPPPIQESAVKPVSTAQAVAAGGKRFTIAPAGKAAIAIPAPLETYRGESKVLSGYFIIDASDLKQSVGEVDVDLDAIQTFTFDEKEKNDQQNEHVHNWFEIGSDDSDAPSVKTADPKKWADYKTAQFFIDKIEESSVKSLQEVPDMAGARMVTLKASGRLRVHGRDSAKTVSVQVTFKGPADAPTELTFHTVNSVVVSLSEHDVKPRNASGKFLETTLAAVGKKLDDKAQITVDGTASRDKEK